MKQAFMGYETYEGMVRQNLPFKQVHIVEKVVHHDKREYFVESIGFLEAVTEWGYVLRPRMFQTPNTQTYYLEGTAIYIPHHEDSSPSTRMVENVREVLTYRMLKSRGS